MEGSPFTLVNSKGEVIPGDQQLGLVLYKRGGTLCLDYMYSNRSRAANAICKEMNYKSAIQMMNEDGSNRWWKKQNSIRYSPELYDVKCTTPNWDDCTWKKPNSADSSSGFRFSYLMIRCSGRNCFFVIVMINLFANCCVRD